MEVLIVLHWSLIKRVGKLEPRASKKGSRCNYTSALHPIPNMIVTRRLAMSPLTNWITSSKRLQSLWLAKRERHGISHLRTSAGVTALELCIECGSFFHCFNNCLPHSHPCILAMAFSATPSTARRSHPQPKCNDLLAELRINILSPMKPVFLILRYIIIAFFIQIWFYEGGVEDDARILEEVPLVRPVVCAAVGDAAGWESVSPMLCHSSLYSNGRRFFLL